MASHLARGAELMIRVFDLSKAVSRALKGASTTVNPFTRCAVDPFDFYGGRGIEKKRGSKISITLQSSHEVMNILKPPKLIPSSRGFVEIRKKRKNVGLEAGTHNVVYLDRDSFSMFKAIAFAALAALMGADAFVSPVATSFSGSAVAQRVRFFALSAFLVMLKIGIKRADEVA